jgi:hypothetical protein
MMFIFITQGEFIRNRQSGSGVSRYADGSIYEGNWENGTKHGKGVMKYKNGIVYEGMFKEGKFSGMGVMKYPSGQVSVIESPVLQREGRHFLDSSFLYYVYRIE